jgi:hypothetical protein
MAKCYGVVSPKSAQYARMAKCDPLPVVDIIPGWVWSNDRGHSMRAACGGYIHDKNTAHSPPNNQPTILPKKKKIYLK